MKKYLLSFLMLLLTNILFAQNPADREISFAGITNTGTPITSSYDAIVTYTDGSSIIGGNITSFVDSQGNTTTGLHNLVRLNPDGTIDNTFNTIIGTGFNKQVRSIALQSDGKILVGGDFTNFNGVTQNRLVRLNANGTIDATANFNIGNGFTSPSIIDDGNGNTTIIDNASVTTVALKTDGQILVGGSFNKFNGLTTSNIVRLATNGVKDTNFAPTDGLNIFQILIQPDNKVLVASTSNTRLRRLNPIDGSDDTNFHTTHLDLVDGIIKSNFDSSVSTVAIQSDGKILVGGSFTDFEDGITTPSPTQNRLIRLNTDGTKDIDFNIGNGFDFESATVSNSKVLSINIQPGGKILVGGVFTTFSGTTSNNIVRLNDDGTKDLTFSTDGFTNTSGNRVSVIKTQPDGKVFVGGSFDRYQSDSTPNTKNIVRLKGATAVLSNNDFQSTDVKISLYPNPTTDYINISTSEDITSYEVYDINGRSILSNKTSDKIVNVSNLTKGMYIITIKTNDGSSTNKFIKN